MKFFTVAALSAFAGVALATPYGPPGGYAPPSRPGPPAAPPAPSPKTTTKAAAPGIPASPTSSAPAGYSPGGSDPHTTAAAPTTTTTTWAITTTTTTTSTTSAKAPYGTVTCLSDNTAAYLVNGFASLLTAFNNDTAEAILANDFSDWSDSINWLSGAPLGAVSIASKSAFETSQASLPAIGFDILAIDAVSCKTIAFRWAATLGSGSPVRGINIIYASNLNGTDAGWQIETNYSEFNSGLWYTELGGTCSF